MKMKIKKPKKMCAWCGRKEAKIARIPGGNLIWCSKKCQEADSDNNLFQETGIEGKDIRECIRAIKNARRC